MLVYINTFAIANEIIDKIPKIDAFQYLFVNNKGNKISDSTQNDMWHNFKREMNIAMGCKVYRNELIPPFPVTSDLVLYCMKHTFCTDLQAAGVPINIAKELINKFHSPKKEEEAK